MSLFSNATPALKSIILDEPPTDHSPGIPPTNSEPPLVKKEGIGKIRFLCNKEMSLKITGNGIDGDDHFIWDRRFADNIQEARDKFYKLMDQGYLAFYVKADGLQGQRMLKFDPNAEEVIMVPPVVAG